MSRRLAVVLPVMLCALVAGCGGGGEQGVDRAEFVAAFVDLREATVRGTLDSARLDSILRAHDVTEADLRGYVEARSDDPDALAETWREVLDSIAARDSVAAAERAAARAATADSVRARADTSLIQPDTH